MHFDKCVLGLPKMSQPTVYPFSPVQKSDIWAVPGFGVYSFFIADSVRGHVVVEESEWCRAGIIEHFEKFKMAAKMAAKMIFLLLYGIEWTIMPYKDF